MQIARSSSQFRYLAQVRLDEALALLRNKKWAGAMYVAGYIVECALKAVIAKRHNDRLPEQYTIHDLNLLRGEVLHHISDQDAAILQQIGGWSHLLRYCTQSPSAVTVTHFINRAKDVLQCLLPYL